MINLIMTLFLIDLAVGCSGRYFVIEGISARTLIFGIALICFFLRSFNTKRFVLNKSILLISLLLLPVFVISILIGLSNNDTSLVLNKAMSYFYLVIVFFLIQTIDEEEKIQKYLKLFENLVTVCSIISIVIWILLFIYKYQIYFIINPYLIGRDLGFLDIINGTIPRVFLRSSIFIPLILNLSLLRFLSNRQKVKTAEVLRIIVLFLGLISTMTIGFWVASIVTTFIIFISKMSAKKVIIVTGLILMTIFVSVKLDVTDYLNYRASSDDISVKIKITQLEMVIDSTKNIFLGNGFGSIINFSVGDVYRSADSIEVMWLELYNTSGLLGVSVYFIFIMYHIVKLFKIYKRTREVIPVSLALSLISLILINFSNPFLNNALGIGYLSLVIAIYCCYEKIYSSKLEISI